MLFCCIENGGIWQMNKKSIWSKLGLPVIFSQVSSETLLGLATLAMLEFSMITHLVSFFLLVCYFEHPLFLLSWVFPIIFVKVMDHHYKSLLLNMPVRHIINKVKSSSDEIKAHLRRLEEMDIKNFFVLGE